MYERALRRARAEGHGPAFARPSLPHARPAVQRKRKREKEREREVDRGREGGREGEREIGREEEREKEREAVLCCAGGRGMETPPYLSCAGSARLQPGASPAALVTCHERLDILGRGGNVGRNCWPAI